MSVEVGYCPVDRIEELMAFIGRSWKANHVFSRDADLLRWQHRHRSDGFGAGHLIPGHVL